MVEKRAWIAAGAGFLIFVGGVAFLVSRNGEVNRVDSRATATAQGGLNPNIKTEERSTPTPGPYEVCQPVNPNNPNLYSLWLQYFNGQNGVYTFKDVGPGGTGLEDDITVIKEGGGEYLGKNGPVHHGDMLCFNSAKQGIPFEPSFRKPVASKPLPQTRVVYQWT